MAQYDGPRRDQLPEIDERWLGEWQDYGYHQLIVYLAKHAAFAEYCRIHDYKEPDESPS